MNTSLIEKTIKPCWYDECDTFFMLQIHPTKGSSVHTMTVEEGHVLNIDGVAGSAGNGTSGGGAGSTANKYKTSNASTTDRAMSGVGRGPSVFQTQGIYCMPVNILMNGICNPFLVS